MLLNQSDFSKLHLIYICNVYKKQKFVKIIISPLFILQSTTKEIMKLNGCKVERRKFEFWKKKNKFIMLEHYQEVFSLENISNRLKIPEKIQFSHINTSNAQNSLHYASHSCG